MRTATFANVIKFFENRVFSLFSIPKYLQSDNGAQFKSKIFNDLMEKYGIVHVFSPKHSLTYPNESIELCWLR